MRRLAVILVGGIILAALPSSFTLADAQNWKLDVSQPMSPSHKNEVTIDYKILSKDETDDFTISISEHGTFLTSHAVTSPYGGSGIFTVPLRAAGNHTFAITAQSGEEIQSVQRTVYFSPPTAAREQSRSVLSNQTDSVSPITGYISSPAVIEGGVVGVTGTGGVVSEKAASTTRDPRSNLLGSNTKDSTKVNATQENTPAWVWVISILMLCGLAYYRFFYSQGKGPLVK